MSDDMKIRPSSLQVYLMPNGDVALESTDLSPQNNLDMFGDNGVLPPQSYSILTEKCLLMIAAVPDETDTAALKAMATTLKKSLADVEKVLLNLK